MDKVVLIAGANGLFGSHSAAAFAAAGWQVRKYQRGTDMAAAAQGAQVIVNGLSPPMYHDWKTLVPQITAQVLYAARASGAMVIVPGNVYVYGDQPGPWGPATPHRPTSRKGAIRAAMEAQYRRAADQGVQVAMLRGGDFIAPDKGHSFLNMIVLKGLAKGKMQITNAPDVTRAWAYLPDMARISVALAERRGSLPAFTDLPFAGFTLTWDHLRSRLQVLTGQTIRFTRFPWWAMTLAAPVWELARELREMRYLYDHPHSLDPAPLAALLPDFRPTDLDTVLREHLARLAPQGRAIFTQTAL